MDDQYIRSQAFALQEDARDVIKDVQSEYSPVDVGEDRAFEPPEVDNLEAVSPEDVMREQFSSGDTDIDFDDEALDYSRQRSVEISSVEVDDTEGHEYARNAQSLSERLESITRLNEKMQKLDSRVRFVATKADAPDNAYVYSVEGFDYYYKVDEKLRPSDVTEINKDDSWWLYDENERVLKTIIALAEKYPEVVSTVEKVEQSYTFTDRVLKTEDEVVGEEDVFTLKQQDAIVATITQAKGAGSKEDEGVTKNRNQLLSMAGSIVRGLITLLDDMEGTVGQHDLERALQEVESARNAIRHPEEGGGPVGSADDVVAVSLVQARRKLRDASGMIDDPQREQALSDIMSELEELQRAADRVLDVEI